MKTAAKPADKRTPAEKEELFGYYLGTHDSEYRKAAARIAELAQEEARLQGRGTVDTADPLLDGSMHVHSTGIPLEFDTGLDRVAGEFPVTVDSYQWYDYLCNKTGGTATPGAPGILQLFVVPNIVEAVDATGRLASFGPPTLELRITPGAMTTTNACGLTGFSGTFYRDLWDQSFADRRIRLGIARRLSAFSQHTERTMQGKPFSLWETRGCLSLGVGRLVFHAAAPCLTLNDRHQTSISSNGIVGDDWDDG